MRYKAEYKPTQMLCPKFYDWVDATIAIAKLRRTQRHVCPLIDEVSMREDKDTDSIVTTTTNDNDNSKVTTTNNNKNKMNMSMSMSMNHDNVDISHALNTLQMDIGAGINVTIDMLQSSGVDVVKPILEEFILEFSPELSKQCLLKLS